MPKQTLTQRPDGRYRVKYQGHEFYGYTQSEALAKRDAFRKDVEAGLRAERQGITFGEYAAQWLLIYKKDRVRPGSYRMYEAVVRNMIDRLGAKRMKDITMTNVQEYYNSLNTRSKSNITLHTSFLTSIFNAAVEDGVILKNPCTKAKAPHGTSGTHRYIERFERDLILQSVGLHPMAIPAMLMLYAGLRCGEASAINLDTDIDYQHNCVIVNKQVVRMDSDASYAPTKSINGNRKVPLLPILADVLKDRHGPAITCVRGRPITVDSFTGQWERYLNVLTALHNGYPIHDPLPADCERIFIRTHDLRHSYATMLYESGVDIKSAARWMGHSDTDEILKIYAHLSSEHEKSAELQLIEFSKTFALPKGSNRGSKIIEAR